MRRERHRIKDDRLRRSSLLPNDRRPETMLGKLRTGAAYAARFQPALAAKTGWLADAGRQAGNDAPDRGRRNICAGDCGGLHV